jgi:hypothetical protein
MIMITRLVRAFNLNQDNVRKKTNTHLLKKRFRGDMK